MLEFILDILLSVLPMFNLDNISVSTATQNSTVFGIDMSIESLRAREFSIYIFIFLILSLILFCFIIYLYLPKKLALLKTGEKIMFGALIFGVILAVIIGYIQLIEGYLL